MTAYRLTKDDIRWMTSCASLHDQNGMLTCGVAAELGDAGMGLYDALAPRLNSPGQIMACEQSAEVVYRARRQGSPWAIVHHSNVYKVLDTVAKLNAAQRHKHQLTEYPFAIYLLRHDSERLRKLPPLIKQAIKDRSACLVSLWQPLTQDRRQSLISFAQDLTKNFQEWALTQPRLLLESNRALSQLSDKPGRVGGFDVHGDVATVRLLFTARTVAIQ